VPKQFLLFFPREGRGTNLKLNVRISRVFPLIRQDSFEISKREQAPPGHGGGIELGLQGEQVTNAVQPGFEGFFEQVPAFLFGGFGIPSLGFI
jgi:hypothetical protein